MPVVAVAMNSDQLLEIYGVGTNGYAYRSKQTAPGEWSQLASAWNDLGPTVTLSAPKMVSELAAAANWDQCIEVFGVGTDSSLWHIVQPTPGSWDGAGWGSFSSENTGSPVVASNADKRLEVFVLGDNSELYHIYQMTKGSWSDSVFYSLGGQNASDPIVGVSAGGALQVFCVGDNTTVYGISQKSQSDTNWGGWSAIPFDEVMSRLSVAIDSKSVLNCFALDLNSNLLAYNNSGSNVATGYLSDPVAATNGNGIIEAFVLDQNNALWSIAQEEASSWGSVTKTNLGGTWIANPAVALNSNNCLEVFALGDNSVIYTLSQTSTGVWPANPSWNRIAIRANLVGSDDGKRVRGRSRGGRL